MNRNGTFLLFMLKNNISAYLTKLIHPAELKRLALKIPDSSKGTALSRLQLDYVRSLLRDKVHNDLMQE